MVEDLPAGPVAEAVVVLDSLSVHADFDAINGMKDDLRNYSVSGYHFCRNQHVY
jgi:hypothetical protein